MDGRHLGCSGTHLLFAKGCGRRPSPARRGRVDGGNIGGSLARSERIAVTPTAARPGGATRGVRGRSGRGEALVASNRGERGPGGTWPKGRAAPRKGPLTRESSAPDRWTGVPFARATNASVVDLPRKGELGSQGSSGPIRSGVSKAAVVLADRFGCRSRRAARGHERPRAKSARKRQGLALPPSGAVGERASEAGPGRRSPGIGGGSAFEGVVRKCGGRAGTRRWKAPWAVRSRHL